MKGDFPSSSGATKMHYLQHVYDQIEFWGFQSRWIDESGLELFHQIIKRSDSMSKRCKSWMIREKTFWEEVYARTHPSLWMD